MKQALHIFRKDVRYLRFPIGILLLLAAGLNFEPGLTVFFWIAALGAIVMLVQAEPIPGDRQFWLTRPYRPLSLLSAKLLFIVPFICLPVALSQTVMILRLGFPFAQELPGLIWTQAVILFLVAVPAAAIASVTSGFGPFAAAILILVAAAVYGGNAMPQNYYPGFLAAGWIRALGFALVISGASAVVLWRQYRERRTFFGRWFGALVYSAALALYLLLPPTVSLTAQTWLSKQPGLASRVEVKPRPELRKGTTSEGVRITRIPLPLSVSGLPEGAPRLDYLSVSLVWPDLTVSPSALGVDVTSREDDLLLHATVEMPTEVYREKRDLPVTIRGTLYLTEFGDARSTRIKLTSEPASIQDGLQCFEVYFGGGQNLECRSFFGSAALLLTAQARGQTFGFEPGIGAYAPFGSTVNLVPLATRFAPYVEAGETTIVTRRPLVHFRRDFSWPNVRLDDSEKP